MTEQKKNGIKQFGVILKFELKGYLTNKTFVGITLFLAVLIAAITFFPRIAAAFDGEIPFISDSGSAVEKSGPPESGSNDEESGKADSGLPVMLIACNNPQDAASIQKSFPAFFPDYNAAFTQEGESEIKKQIEDGQAECAFVFDSLLSYTYYVNDLSMHDQNTVIADELLQRIYTMTAMIQGGMTEDEAAAALTMAIEHETVKLGKDQVQNFLYTYIMIFALYMVILLYGQMIAMNVATEKSSRAMELLITSARPVSMMFGKVLASCLAGLLQLIVVFGAALACFQVNKSYWNDNYMIASMFDIPAALLGYMLLFFILGFLIYAFMFGAVGSTASKVEDLNTSVMPVTLLFVAGFIVTMTSLSSGNTDGFLIKACSFIPFTSPMAMFTRLAMSTVAPYEIIISVAVLAISVIGIGFISAKIYRAGVLLYGTKPKISRLLKAMK